MKSPEAPFSIREDDEAEDDSEEELDDGDPSSSAPSSLGPASLAPSSAPSSAPSTTVPPRPRKLMRDLEADNSEQATTSTRPWLQVPPRRGFREHTLASPLTTGSLPATSPAPPLSPALKTPTTPLGSAASQPPRVPPVSGPLSPPKFKPMRKDRVSKSVVFAPTPSELLKKPTPQLGRAGSMGQPSGRSDDGSEAGLSAPDPALFSHAPSGDIPFSAPLARNPFPFQRPVVANRHRSGEVQLGYEGPTPISRGGPHPNARGGPVARGGPNAIQQSVIMCMDPTCNKCPPEMHALRNRRLVEKMQRQAAEGSEDGDEDEKREGKSKSEKAPVLSLQDELDDELENDFDIDRDVYGAGDPQKQDPEAGRRMVIRICGLKIVIQRGKRNHTWLRVVQFARDLRETLHFNPNNPYIQKWNQAFMFAALLGFFFDPLFFFIFTATPSSDPYEVVHENWVLAYVFISIMSVVQLWYLLHILITFRTAYVVPPPREAWWTGELVRDPSNMPPGDLVFDGKLIARHYIRSGGFLIDFISVIPLPQILVLVVVPRLMGSNLYAVLVCLTILLQEVPRAIRLSLKFMGDSGSGILDSAWTQFGINLFLYFLAAHVVGSTWYLFSVQRVQECVFQGDPYSVCVGEGGGSSQTLNWGIFVPGMVYASKESYFFVRYLGSLYWGFQQLSTLAGNQEPAPWEPEIIFIMIVSCVGLLLLALLIGNMSNFLQALSRKTFEYQMNKRDVQNWMYRRNIPNRLQRRVNELLRLQWATTLGVEDNEVLPLLTEDLQRDLRRRLSEKLLTVSPLFSAMNQQLLDAFLERLQQRIYIDGTIIVKEGYPVSRMFFVLKGEVLRSSNKSGMIGKDNLNLGDFVGEEVIVQYVDKYSQQKNLGRSGKFGSRDRGREIWLQSRATGTIGRPAVQDPPVDVLPVSKFTALCVGPVEGYSLEAKDVEMVCRQYWKYLQDEKVQLALKRCSRTRMMHYARTIQVAWRRYQRQKYNLSMEECVRAAVDKRFYKLISLKKSESTAAKLLEDVLNGDDEESEKEATPGSGNNKNGEQQNHWQIADG